MDMSFRIGMRSEDAMNSPVNTSLDLVSDDGAIYRYEEDPIIDKAISLVIDNEFIVNKVLTNTLPLGFAGVRIEGEIFMIVEDLSGAVRCQFIYKINPKESDAKNAIKLYNKLLYKLLKYEINGSSIIRNMSKGYLSSDYVAASLVLRNIDNVIDKDEPFRRVLIEYFYHILQTASAADTRSIKKIMRNN